jgi:murein DD-endopeptidase MepM/ murein hydrolase activator NlpD
MAAEPSRRLLSGGKTAVHVNLGAIPAPGGPIRAVIAQRAMPLALAAGALLLAAGATALPSRQSAAVTLPLAPSPPAYVGGPAAAAPAPASAAADDSTEVRFTGTVGPDFTAALKAAGVPERQGREYVALLARAIDLSGGLSVEDKFDLVLQRDPDSGALGQLIYAGLDRIARADVELLKWTDGRQVIWVNADGVGGEQPAEMRLPVSGRVTSGFGSRFHPILGYARMHKGVDLAARMGAPITAAADGRVVSAGWHGGYGRQVIIAHRDGVETAYGHMSRMVAQAGQTVRQGQLIGYVGSSGLSTGPHVHYEVLKNGRPVNPMSVKLGGGPGHLEGEKLHQFRDALRSVLSATPSRG